MQLLVQITEAVKKIGLVAASIIPHLHHVKTFAALKGKDLFLLWRSGYCYLNKGECNLNQSKDDSFVERVAKNNS